MKLIKINTRPTRRQLNEFGIAWLIFFLLLSALLMWKGTSASVLWVLVTAAFLIPLIGYFCPPFMRLIYLGMTFAAYPIGFIVSHLILMMVYYLIITPTGMVLRLTKRGFFPKKPDKRIQSYWISKTKSRNPDDYFKQY
jgi:hypothetical protein